MPENISSFNPLALAILLGAISLIPLLLMITTCFLKVSTVMMLTRNAIGVQQVPPNMALYGIALAATLFVMAPVLDGMQTRFKEKPLDTTSTEKLEASLNYGIEPLTHFMTRNTDPDVLTHLTENAQKMWPKDLAADVVTHQDNLLLLIPAFVLSELQSAFKIAFLIFIPFLVVDLVVSNVLLALGMQMVSPMTISLPLKILLFVMVSGWTRLLDGLFYSYQ
ncbi:EscR/YscR/HrcR family type III secretion system export apparatus protein [Pantoea sp. Al-1710]|uniref:EscR/YscR/HrcR family type III secretion system export apparatus protein n=1 Tax=Candidatus Pantoea communis TaxID=2608354 RepID=A0ABX0RI90_9GAMM|nr:MULTISPECIES: type III secretion system export apparatus subunit SctR [Pantoea]NIG12937.1 EscR/YscR/HrcR family type III secretion system export apparatus protein [Pantoea sp. Cy-640]NIG17362.1 EscR/YscR/HrcR family type III secretion system export apparatus protein [Pantoea communis]